MKYQAPQIVDSYAAEEAIKGIDKTSPDSDGVDCTPAAYEADE